MSTTYRNIMEEIKQQRLADLKYIRKHKLEVKRTTREIQGIPKGTEVRLLPNDFDKYTYRGAVMYKEGAVMYFHEYELE